MPIKKTDNTKKHSSSFIISKVEHSKIKTIFDIIHIDDLRSKLFFLILKYDTDLIANMHHKNDQLDNKAYLTNYEALFWLNKRIQQELIYYVHQNQLFPDIFYTVHSDNFNRKIFEKRLPFYITWYSPKEVNKFIKQYQEYNDLIDYFIRSIIAFSYQSRDLKNIFYINIENKYKSFIFYKNGECKSSIAPNNPYNNGSLLSARIFIKSLICIYKYFYHSSDQNFYADFIERILINNLSEGRIKEMKKADPPFEKFLPLKEALLHLILYYSCTDNLGGINFFLFLHKHFLRQKVYETDNTDILNDPLWSLEKKEFNDLFEKEFQKKLNILYQNYDIQKNDTIIQDLTCLFGQILSIGEKSDGEKDDSKKSDREKCDGEKDDSKKCDGEKADGEKDKYIPAELATGKLLFNLLDQYTRCGFLDVNAHIDLLQIQLKPYCVEYNKLNFYLPGLLFYCKHNFFISSNTLTPKLLDHIAKKEKETKKIFVVTDSYQSDVTNDNATLILNKSVAQELAQLKINTFNFDLNEYIGSLKSEDITNQDILFFKKQIFLLNISLLRKVNILYINSNMHCPEISLLSDITHMIDGNFLKHEYCKLLKHFQIIKKYVDNFLHDVDKIKTIDTRDLESHQIKLLIKDIHTKNLIENIKKCNVANEIHFLENSLNNINTLETFEDIKKSYACLIEKTKQYIDMSKPILNEYQIFTDYNHNCLCNVASVAKKNCLRCIDDRISGSIYDKTLSNNQGDAFRQNVLTLKDKPDFFLMDCVQCKTLEEVINKSRSYRQNK